MSHKKSKRMRKAAARTGREMEQTGGSQTGGSTKNEVTLMEVRQKDTDIIIGYMFSDVQDPLRKDVDPVGFIRIGDLAPVPGVAPLLDEAFMRVLRDPGDRVRCIDCVDEEEVGHGSKVITIFCSRPENIPRVRCGACDKDIATVYLGEDDEPVQSVEGSQNTRFKMAALTYPGEVTGHVLLDPDRPLPPGRRSEDLIESVKDLVTGFVLTKDFPSDSIKDGDDIFMNTQTLRKNILCCKCARKAKVNPGNSIVITKGAVKGLHCSWCPREIA